jgi:cobalt-zinc-cadmium efflux system protein
MTASANPPHQHGDATLDHADHGDCAGHDHHHHGHDGHGHHHGAGHHHHHIDPTKAHGPVFAITIALNLGFVLAEIGAGIWGSSTALLADAGHNFSDVLAIVLAWVASLLAKRPASARYTYGLKASSILAALANAALLWVALGAILIETLRNLAAPQPVASGLMMAVAAIGIAINGLSAVLFARLGSDDINLRAAFQHMLADAVVSAGVVAAGAAVWLTGWNWIDPVAGLVIIAVIGWGSWSLLTEATRLALLGVPDNVDEARVRAYLTGRPGVAALHDLHIWPMSTTETALTAHLVMPAGHPGDAWLAELAHAMEHDFKIGHTTIQIELESGETCAAGCA